MARIGFIGLGIMGMPMARHLLKAGHELTVSNRSPAKVETLVAEGAQRASTPREVAGQSDIVMVCVPDSPDVEQVVLGEDGVIHAARRDMIVVDHSTVSSDTAIRCAESLAATSDALFLDAPVSGGEEGAIHGRLAIMVGGRREAFERVRPIMEAYGKSIIHVGGAGAGQVTKAVNQILVGAGLLAIAEGLTLAQRAGVDPQKVVEAIAGGAAGSWILDNRAPKMIAEDYQPGFKSVLHAKDMRLAVEAAKSTQTQLQLTPLVQRAFAELVNAGDGEMDHTALKRFVEMRNVS